MTNLSIFYEHVKKKHTFYSFNLFVILILKRNNMNLFNKLLLVKITKCLRMYEISKFKILR